MNKIIKALLKKLIPASVLLWRSNRLLEKALLRHDTDFSEKSPKEIFSKIYAKKMWGGGAEYCSGPGSHLQSHVDSYVESVSIFLNQFPNPVDVVDLGCGDFNVGKQIRDKAARYVACDVVPDLIARNIKLYAELDVDFRVVDITKDILPGGEVFIIRQVLQHLSNAAIMKVVSKLGQFRYLILTEFVPTGSFIPNVDQPTGSYSRLARGIRSGIVLTEPPFNLQVKSEKLICETPEQHGALKTIVYEF
jgi:hypothetical protein